MNYYERHIGDYIRDTVSLTMLEDGAYNRLLDQYYQTERPLPADKKEIYRLARANSAPERKAVDYVLQRYFEATSEGYRQKRCDEVIEDFWERDHGKESKRENDRERQRRARERRANLFDELRSHGIVPAFNTPTRELQTQLSRVTERDESKNVTRDNTATQTPLPNPQDITTTDVVVVDSVAADPTLTPAKPAKPDCPHQAIVALYHELLPMCPGIRDWTPARAQALRARWNEDPKRQDLAYWRKFFGYVAESDFLTGRSSSAGRKPFLASLDWIVKAENFTKIREGRYHEQVTA